MFLKDRMELNMIDSIGWIACNYLSLSPHEMPYGINIAKIVCDWSGSGKEKSDGIRWHLSRQESHQFTFVSVAKTYFI